MEGEDQVKATPPDVVIPPRASAVPGIDTPAARTSRDFHLQVIAEQGLMGSQQTTKYGRRSLVEIALGRYKHLIGPEPRADTLIA
ncbi:MAG: hypothetical protein ACRYG8_29575 [Janthinobacterium lividum]